MAYKSSRGNTTIPKGVTVKWVKKARMWCKTYAKDGKQMQEWSTEKPDNSIPGGE